MTWLFVQRLPMRRADIRATIDEVSEYGTVHARNKYSLQELFFIDGAAAQRLCPQLLSRVRCYQAAVLKVLDMFID